VRNLYNSATLLECILVSDEVWLSPTSAWSPDRSDVLFAPDGPCRQLRHENLSDVALSQVFGRAIDIGAADLSSGQIGSALVRDAERVISNQAHAVRDEAWLPHWGGLSQLGGQAPLSLPSH